MISELDKSRCYTVACGTRDLKYDRISGFQTIYHALEISQGSHGHSVYAGDYIALIEGLLP